MRAAAYVRLSRMTEQTTSPERQAERCKLTAEARGWEVVRLFEDLDVSATDLEGRRAWTDLLAAAEAGEFDAVLVWRLDRLARSVAHLSAIVDRLEAAGVALVSATEPFDLSTPMGKAMVQITGVFAELERATIATRVQQAQEHMRKVGRWRGGRRPFGWRPIPNPDGSGQILEEHPEEAEEYRRIIEEFLEGASLVSLAESLQDRGVLTAGGSETWYPASVRSILTTRKLIGELERRRKDGTRYPVFGDDGRALSPFPPLIDQRTFDAVQEEMNRRKKSGTRTRDNANLLLSGGLGLCASCGEHLITGKSRGERRQYRCAQAARPKSVRTCEHRSTITVDSVHEYIERTFLDDFGHMEVTHFEEPEIDRDREERERLRRSLLDLEEARYVRGEFGDDIERYETIHGRLRDALDALPEPGPSGEAHVIRTGQTFAEAWQEAVEDVNRRRALLQSCYAHILITPARRVGGTTESRDGAADRLVFEQWPEPAYAPDLL